MGCALCVFSGVMAVAAEINYPFEPLAIPDQAIVSKYFQISGSQTGVTTTHFTVFIPSCGRIALQPSEAP